MLIDTHTHLDDARYDDDRDAMIARAREAGVEAMITIGCDLATSRAALDLAGRYEFVYASVGVHPHEVKHIEDHWYDEFRKLAGNKKIVAYGEIGLDYHYNNSPPEEQRRRFREQVNLAKELRLPLVIHTREAQEDTIRILREEQASVVGGVLHCFSGDAWLAKDALDLGFYLSFSGARLRASLRRRAHCVLRNLRDRARAPFADHFLVSCAFAWPADRIRRPSASPSERMRMASPSPRARLRAISASFSAMTSSNSFCSFSCSLACFCSTAARTCGRSCRRG